MVDQQQLHSRIEKAVIKVLEEGHVPGRLESIAQELADDIEDQVEGELTMTLFVRLREMSKRSLECLGDKLVGGSKES